MLRFGVCAVLLAVLTAGVVAPRAVPADEPTPGPAATPGTDLERMPGASQKDVTRLLRKVRKKYGEDAVKIQAQLLMQAMRAGSDRGIGVRVEGITTFRSQPYLLFFLETGLVFDDLTRDETARIQWLWGAIVEPTLTTVKLNGAGPNGVAVDAEYHHRPYKTAAELHASLTETGTPERVRFYVDPAALRALFDGAVNGHDLIQRAIVTVDGKERTTPIPLTDWPTSPGPLPPS